MKESILKQLEEFKKELLTLKRDVTANAGNTINRTAIRARADAVATMWVEDIRSQLEHKIQLPKELIEKTAAEMKQLHVLSRPSNRKTSYLKVITSTLSKFDDKFILPIKSSTSAVESIFDLHKLVPGLPDDDESDYLKEAVQCAQHGYKRAAIVLGWCAAIDRLQKVVLQIGFARFNAAAEKIRAQTSGKYKRWNKKIECTSKAELQTVFDSDLVIILEGLELFDGNQTDRLETCFSYRNHSAHPGEAPIGDANVVAFFSDINAIVFQNPKLQIGGLSK